MKTIHYTIGYGGKLNYITICGKEIKSHSETESATIDPGQVTCKACRSKKEWKEDLGFSTGQTKEDIRRIFIESDILHASELQNAQSAVVELCEAKGLPYSRRVFAEVLQYAWHDLEGTWAAVKKADEIYADSSLMPLVGNTYMGAPVIFNGMCDRAVKEGVSGKSVFILNNMKNVYWGMIDIPLMQKAFEKNSLYMYDEQYNIQKIDVWALSNKLKQLNS